MKTIAALVAFFVLSVASYADAAEENGQIHVSEHVCGDVKISNVSEYLPDSSTRAREIYFKDSEVPFFSEMVRFTYEGEVEAVTYGAFVYTDSENRSAVATSTLWADLLIAYGELWKKFRQVAGREETGDEWACIWGTAIVDLPK